MKKNTVFFRAILLGFLFITSCGNKKITQADKAKIIKEYQDSINLAGEKKRDSLNSFIPKINVNIYVRMGVIYDSEGWPVEMGKVVIAKDFQEKGEYELTGYDYIEKIEIEGEADDISLQFINGKSMKILHQEEEISLNKKKTYTTSNPKAEKDNYYQDWLETKWDALIIKIIHKNKSIFEGKINPSKQ